METASKLILTPEQKGMRLLERRHGEAGQIGVMQRAMARALNGASAELAEEGAQPSFTAAMGAIANMLADHLARIADPRERARLVHAVAAELPMQVETRVLTHEPQGRG